MIDRPILRATLTAFSFAILLVAGNGAAYAARGDLEQPRRDYRAAKRALSKGHITHYRRLRKRLDNYILKAYLDYAYLKKRIATTPPPTLERFLKENADAAVSERLRRKWLHQLARKGRWKTFFRQYRDIPGDTKLRCYRLHRLLETGLNRQAMMSQFKAIWLTGKSQPQACDPLFAAWHKRGYLDGELVWARIRLAMERRRPRLAGYLANKYLNPRDRQWVRHWQAMHRNPGKKLRRIDFPVETPIARMIIRHGVVRLGRRDPEGAMRQWLRLKKRHRFLREDEDYVLRRLGLMAAREHLPAAVAWLAAAREEGDDEKLRHWRVRAALRNGDWVQAKRFVQSLTVEERRDRHWRYLWARILEQNGGGDEAGRVYTELAGQRSYYGFLAADRINAPYVMGHASILTEAMDVHALESRPAVRMALELFTLGETLDARRQWAWATRAMDSSELRIAASIAYRHGWHDRAILTATHSGHRDDLDLRFPMLYRDLVLGNAQREDLDPEWIYGVLRQESAFVTDARSRAGALGLMQLMPRTGRRLGRRLKLRIRSRGAILNVANNIRLGSSYLKSVLERYGGSQLLATAAYNAGPYRVRRWLPESGTLDADLWVETIPFNETRRYVKNVMGFTTVYGHRLGNPPTRLRERMPPVTPLARKQ